MLFDGAFFCYNICYIFNIIIKNFDLSFYFAMSDMQRNLKQIKQHDHKLTEVVYGKG